MPKRFLKGKILLLIVFLFALIDIAASQSSPNFTALTTKNGLSSNMVSAILKDRNGLMWFGTSDGLDKFDGTNFTVYYHNTKNATSIPSNDILSMCEDRSGRIWIGTGSGGIVYYDRQHDSFIRYNVKDKLWPNSDRAYIRSMCEDHKGNLWIGTNEGGIRILNLHDLKVSKVLFNYIKAGQPNSFAILTMFEDSRHRMWIGTNYGLYLYNWNSGKFTFFYHSDKDSTSLSSSIIKSLTEDTHGNLWIGTMGGLNLLKPDGKSFRKFMHSEKTAGSISNDNIYVVAPAMNDKLWLGTEGGLNIFDLQKLTAVAIVPNRRNVFSLTDKSVRSIYIDNKGLFWLGTYQGGVNKYDKNLALFNLKQSNPFDPNGLSAPVVTSFAEYTNGNIFIGTDGGGLQLFNRKSELLQHYDIRSSIKKSGRDLTILSLKLDKTGKLWIGTYHDGLFRFEPSTGRYRQFLAGNRPEDINQNDIFCIEEDRRGNIWIGTNGNGINVYDPESQTFTKYNGPLHHPGIIDFPANGFIRSITETKQGDIWIGSFGSGISIFHPSDKTLSAYDKSNNNLSDDAVLSTFQDRRGDMWVGTNGGGLNLFDKQNKKFISYSEKDGLPNGIIFKILQDDSGLLWLTTDKGISSFDPATKRIKNFTGYNGAQESPFVFGAGLYSKAGELYFGGQEGFNYFNPSLLPSNRYIPSVLLTDLKVSNLTILPRENGPINEQIGIAKEIRLDYGQNFSISYVALNYTSPQQSLYSYKLIGYDKDWNYVGTSKTANYTNLDPGSYVFQVRASNNEGLWNNQVTSIRIHILPPIWRTAYAYICYSLLIIGAFFYVRNRSMRKIKMQFAVEQEKNRGKLMIQQERHEAERLHELDLLKIKFLTNLSHEFRTPISLILAPADKLLSMLKEEVTSKEVHVIKRNAKRLLNLVNQLLDFRKMEEHELKLNLASGDLIALIKEAVSSFQDLSEKKRIDLQFESERNNLYASFDHDKVERIVFNLLSNAFKFTYEGGSVKVHLFITEDTGKKERQLLCLKVSDTGIGIPPEKQKKIFERFFQHDNAVDILNQGSGIGLSITREFVELHGGSIKIESTPSKGSTFIVYLPVISIDNLIEASSASIANAPEEEEMDNHISIPDSAEQHEELLSPVLMPTILLVEDNDDFRFYLKDNLKAYYQIIEAANGKDGWQKTLSSHPQLIVSDISMPVMNGIELCKKIKSDKRTSHIPLILLTAITGEEDQIKGLETGANDYMTKPFSFEILNAKIKNLLLFNKKLKDTYSKQIQVTGEEIKIESEDARLLNDIVRYIEDKMNDPELSVEELSKHVCMSRGSLYHKLLELTGLSPVEYIRAVKLDRAATLLEKSDYNVTQVGYMTGFGTPSYFSRMFKSRFQMLPSEYLNLKRGKKNEIENKGDG